MPRKKGTDLGMKTPTPAEIIHRHEYE